MAVFISKSKKNNRERLEALNKVKDGLPLMQGQQASPYSQGIADIVKRAQDYAAKTGQSPLKVADLARMNEADYIRRANLYNFDPNAFRLNTLSPEMKTELGLTDDPNSFRGKQLGLSQMLMDRASGKTPSIAEAQLRQGLDQNQRNLMSAMASGRPGQSGGAFARALARGYGQNAAQMNASAALARLQEQAQAEQNLASLLGQARGQDYETALNAMKANMAGGMGLEEARANSLANLLAQNPDAMVRTRQQKGGILRRVGKITGAVAGPVGAAIGSIWGPGGAMIGQGIGNAVGGATQGVTGAVNGDEPMQYSQGGGGMSMPSFGFGGMGGGGGGGGMGGGGMPNLGNFASQLNTSYSGGSGGFGFGG